jgi:hypothetical protein
VAETASAEALSVSRGSLVAFRGTSVQCLVFGPLSRVKGRNGILCFKGQPRQHAAGTRWVSMTSTSIDSSTSSTDGVYRAITSATTIRSTVAVSLGSTFSLAGVRYRSKGRAAELGCRFQLVTAIDSGQKAVICADVNGGRPIPNSYGFVITQRRVASVTFRSDGRVEVDASWRQPPCACDK